MHESESPRRKLRLGWIVAGAVLLFFGWFGYQLFGPNPSIVVSKETTFITEPLGADGLPDYEAYWLQQDSAGVTPENNAAVLIWQAMWPGELEQEHWLPMCNALGMAEVPSAKKSLVSPYDQTVREQIALDLIQRFPDPAGDEADADEDLNAEEEYGGGEYGGDGSEYGEYGGYGTGDWQTRLQDEMAEALIDEAMGRPWTSEQIPALAQWVEQNQQPLDLLVEASARPRYFSPSPTMLSSSDSMLIDMLLPDIQMMRYVVRSLLVRAMWHLGEDRPMEAWQDLLACHRLARLTAENDTLIGQLVAIAIDGVACQGTKVMMHHGGLSAVETRQILTELNKLGAASSCVRALDQGERLWCLDTIVGLAQGTQDAFESLGYSGNAMRGLDYARVDWNLILRMGNRWYNKLIAAAKLPTRDQRNSGFAAIDIELIQVTTSVRSPTALLGGLLNKKRRSEMVGHVIFGMFLPATSAAFNAEDRSNTQLELTRLAAALAVYRAEQGEYPEKLANLVPAVLPKLPIDLYSGQSFLYRRQDDGGYLLYSVFENGIDDQGTNMSGDIIAGEWVDEQPDDFDYEESDLVIRMPVPVFEFPDPPKEDDFGYGGYGEGGYGGE